MTGRVGGSPSQITHLVRPEQDKRIERPRDVKIKAPTVDVRKMQALAEQSRELGKVGTKAQILALKAEIKSMDLDGIAPPPELSTLETLKKFGVDIKDGIGSGLLATTEATKEFLIGKAISGRELSKLGEQVETEGQESQDLAQSIRVSGQRISQISQTLREMASSDDMDVLKVDDLLLEAQKIFTELDLGGDHFFIRDALSHPDNPFKVKEAAQILQSSLILIDTKASIADEHGRKLKSLGKDLQTQGGSQIAGGLSEVLQMASPIVETTNFVAQSVYAAQSGKSLVDAVTSSSGAVMKGAAISTITGVVGGLQIVSEGLELYNNGKALHSSLKKVEMAKVLLASPVERQKIESDLESKISKLDKPGRFKKLFSTQKGRESEKAKLLQKLKAIRSLPTSDQIPQEAKAVAEQVLKRADTGFKKARILKNILGIAAGSIAIAVAVGAMATPVGWVAAGVALTAAVGCSIYSTSKEVGRQSKIDNAQKSITQSDMKISLKEQQMDQLKSQIQALQSSMSERQQAFHKKPITESSEQDFEISMISDQATLSRLQAQLDQVTGERDTLKTQHSQAVLQLMAVSPEHAAKAVIEGVRKDDPSMKFLAERVLGVKGIKELPDQVAIKLLSRGMSISPEY